MMSIKIHVGRLLCPAIAVVTAFIFYWAPWFVLKATAFFPISLDMTIADIVRESIPATLWFWATIAGFVLVIAAGLNEIEAARVLTTFGGILVLAFPARSLWQLITDGNDLEGASISPGWGLLAVLILGVTIVYLGPRIEKS